MIKLRWLGHACFHIEMAGVDIITDPAPLETGYEITPQPADIVTISHQHWDHNDLSRVTGHPQVFDRQGTFTHKGISITGMPSYHDRQQGQARGDNLIFHLQNGDLSLAHLGDLGDFADPEVIARLQGLDILLIPVGGVYTIDADAAYELTGRLRPKVVIPMHFQTPSLNFSLEPVEKFILKFPRVQKVPQLEYLPQDDHEIKVIVLDYS